MRYKKRHILHKTAKRGYCVRVAVKYLILLIFLINQKKRAAFKRRAFSKSVGNCR